MTVLRPEPFQAFDDLALEWISHKFFSAALNCFKGQYE